LQLSQPWYLSVNYAYTGSRSDTDFNTFEQVSLEPFSLVGFYSSFVIKPNQVKVFVRGDNMLNDSFTEVFGFNTRGRNIHLGFSLNL